MPADVIPQHNQQQQLPQVSGPKVRKLKKMKLSEESAREMLKQAVRASTIGHISAAFLPDVLRRKLSLETRIKLRLAEGAAILKQPAPLHKKLQHFKKRVRNIRLGTGAAASGAVGSAMIL